MAFNLDRIFIGSFAEPLDSDFVSAILVSASVKGCKLALRWGMNLYGDIFNVAYDSCTERV